MEILIILLTSLYFMMGFGTFRLWAKNNGMEHAIFIISVWPLVLMVCACVERDE